MSQNQTGSDNDPLKTNSLCHEQDIRAADKLYNEGKLQDAMEIYLKVLDVHNSLKAESKIELASLYHKLGLVSLELARFSQAHSYLTQGLELCKLMEEGDKSNFMQIMLCIGDTYLEEYKLENAESMFTDTLETFRKQFGENSVEVAVCYNRLADLCWFKENYKEASSYLDKAGKILRPENEENQIEVSNYHYLRAKVHEKLEEYENASSEIQKSLEIRKLIFNENHPKIADCLGIIGRICIEQQEYSEALKNFERELKTKLGYFGENHPKIAYCYSEIGRADLFMSEHTAAFQNFTTALGIIKDFFGENNPVRAEIYMNMGHVMTDKDMLKEALGFYKHALGIETSFFGEMHPSVAQACYHIANIYLRRGKLDKAIAKLQQMLQIELKVYGAKDVSVGKIYQNMGTVYYEKGDYNLAMKSYIDSVKIFIGSEKRRQGMSQEGACYYNLHVMLEDVGDLSTCISLAKKTLLIAKRFYGKTAPTVLEMTVEDAQKRLSVQDLNYKDCI